MSPPGGRGPAAGAENRAALATVGRVTRPFEITGDPAHPGPFVFTCEHATKLRWIKGPPKKTDQTYIDDAVAAHLAAAERLTEDPGAVGGRAFFISSGKPVEGTITAADIHENGGRQPGSFTIIVGGQDWTFDSVQCRFGEDQFTLSGFEDGLSISVSRDVIGSLITFDRIEAGDGPPISYISLAETVALQIDGTSLSGLADFLDNTIDDPVPIRGTIAGTCP